MPAIFEIDRGCSLIVTGGFSWIWWHFIIVSASKLCCSCHLQILPSSKRLDPPWCNRRGTYVLKSTFSSRQIVFSCHYGRLVKCNNAFPIHGQHMLLKFLLRTLSLEKSDLITQIPLQMKVGLPLMVFFFSIGISFLPCAPFSGTRLLGVKVRYVLLDLQSAMSRKVLPMQTYRDWDLLLSLKCRSDDNNTLWSAYHADYGGIRFHPKLLNISVSLCMEHRCILRATFTGVLMLLFYDHVVLPAISSCGYIVR